MGPYHHNNGRSWIEREDVAIGRKVFTVMAE